MTFTLTPHQEAAVQRMVSEPTRAVLNGSELGTGKTAMAVSTVKRLNLGVNVVTGPLHTLDGWERHFDLLAAGDVKHANNKNKAGKLALSDLKFGVPGNYFLGREYARLLDWSHIPTGAWVSDECHSWVNPKSRGFKSHQKMNTEFQLMQSATWFGSSFENAWSVARMGWKHLDGYGQIADRSRYRWVDYWCRTEYDPFAPMNKKILGEEEPGRFASEIPCYIRMESDLPDLEPIIIHYDLTPVQRKIYKQMEEESLVWLQENPLVAELDITRRIRLREIALAEPMIDADGQVQFAPDARSALYDTLTELESDLLGEQILMGTHSAKYARYVAARLGGKAFAWTGQASEEQRAAAKHDFINGRIRHMVATQAAAAEGIDGWQHASHVMFELSQPDSPVLRQQFAGRLNRQGQTKRVLCYKFIPHDTLEDEGYTSMLSKELEMRQSTMLLDTAQRAH